MVGILTEENFVKTFWGQQIFFSLTERLRTKRISYCEITDRCYADLEAVFIIAADYNWTKCAIEQLNAGGYTPVLLCNQSEAFPGCLYSCVCADVKAAMKVLMETLKQKGKKRIAIYGVNNNSISDISRVNDLFLWKDDKTESLKLFYNDGSFENCFTSFYGEADDFDAVICMNDYVAISLVNKLKERCPQRLAELEIFSCAESQFVDRYKEHITALHISFDQYGKAAVNAYELLKKQGNLSTITLRVAYSIGGAKDKRQIPLELCLEGSDSKFYKDSEFRQLHIADMLFNIPDPTDRLILKLLAEGKSYETIAGECYLSVGSVKYRIKRVLALVGSESKSELIDILKKHNPY